MKKINIKGQDYVPVHERLMEFWKNHPSWSIRTRILLSQDGLVRFKAFIFDENGKLRAMGHVAIADESISPRRKKMKIWIPWEKRDGGGLCGATDTGRFSRHMYFHPKHFS